MKCHLSNVYLTIIVALNITTYGFSSVRKYGDTDNEHDKPKTDKHNDKIESNSKGKMIIRDMDGSHIVVVKGFNVSPVDYSVHQDSGKMEESTTLPKNKLQGQGVSSEQFVRNLKLFTVIHTYHNNRRFNNDPDRGK
jgi:hypothetical protein